MIEFSLGKLFLLALIALIVLGPEKLPGAARTAGALLRRVRSGWDNVRAEVERELEIEEIKKAAREAAGHAEATKKELRDTVEQAREPFKQGLMTGKSAVADAEASLNAEAPVDSDEPVSSEIDDSRQAELPLSSPATPAPREPSHDDA